MTDLNKNFVLKNIIGNPMAYSPKENDNFSTQLMFVDDENNQKTLNIPINNQRQRKVHANFNNYVSNNYVSKSWSGNFYCDRPNTESKNLSVSPTSHIFNPYGSIKVYDAMTNCKSAGIIPYAIHNGKIYFLFQRALFPIRKKDSGWNDFGGKKINSNEETAETAAREFSEETSCLFYLKEQGASNKNFSMYYDILKDNPKLMYDSDAILTLKKLIPFSQQYYQDKITEFVLPIYISSKETYISYFVKVPFIPEDDLPRAEDIHIPYDDRYLRECKWFDLTELMALDKKDFHKRLQITRIQQRIQNYHEKELFS